jgi:hypothetical protein
MSWVMGRLETTPHGLKSAPKAIGEQSAPVDIGAVFSPFATG